MLTPEIWNPATGQWRVAADMSVPRNYHSLALLLPDGRVLAGGGGLGGGDHRDAQLYSPPTLFNPDGTLAARPVLDSAPQSIGVATHFTVSGTPGLQKFSFIKMSAITHSVNTDLRYLSLPFSEISAGVYDITAHSSLNVMTPGYWMLFGLDEDGIHSQSKIILVDAISRVSVAEPGNQSSYVNQSASLQMVASGPAGSVLAWSATGLPAGMSIASTTGLINGTPTTVGTFTVQISATDGNTSDSSNFTWTVQPVTFKQSYANFTGASGLTFNGNAALSGSVLRVTPNSGNKVGSTFLTSPVTIGPNTSISTRFVFQISGTTDGADGLTFVMQGTGATAIGAAGGSLGYEGIGSSVAVEVDNYQGGSDPNANHLGILSGGIVATHIATFTPGWDLENAASHTLWVDYDGLANQLRVYAAQGIVTTRPASAVMTATMDLPALLGAQAWLGFTAATGGAFNNHDISAWNVTVNAFALPTAPVLTAPGNLTNVKDVAVNRQMQATDANGDLLTWSASGLPSGLTINAATGLITGTPSSAGTFSSTVTVTDGNTTPVSTSFTWTINNPVTVQPISGVAVVAGTTVPLTAVASGGLNPMYRWSFGDGTPDTAFSVSPATSHNYPTAGRFLVTVTVRDDTGREVTASYRQGVYAPLTASRPTSSSSIAYESRTGANSRLWVVNPDNDSVSVFDVVTRAKLAEITVGQAPRSLAVGPNGRIWVVNKESASLTILKSDYSIAQTVNLPRGSRPFGLVFDPAGLNAYVALEDTGKVLKLNPTTGATLAALNVGLNVRHLSVTADGAKLLATRFITPRLPGEATAIVQTTVSGVDYGGEVLVIDTATLTSDDTIILHHSEQPDTSNSGKGIPNYLGAAAISPDGQSAWVPSKQDNIKRGTLRIGNGGSLTHDMSVRSIASRIVMASQTEDLAGRIDFDNAGIGSAAAFGPNGIYLFTALEGSREVAVADAYGKQEILRFETGRAPQGLVLSPDGRTLYVHNFMDRTVSIHDLNALANGTETSPPVPVILNCVGLEKLSATVLLGKQLFYDTRDIRVAFQQYLSCASCHNDGDQDGRVWDFTQFGEGLRNTITLRGHGGVAQGPLHWTGNFNEVQDFEGQIRNFALGTGLMSDALFHAGTRSQPLGDTKAGLSTDLDALASYISSLTAQGKSPDRNSDGTMTSAAWDGYIVFQQKNCAQCHSGSQYTDSTLGVFHNIGTLKAASGQRMGATLTGLDTPTLYGLWATAPYLHDGSASTLEEAIGAHSGVTLNPTEMNNLVAFVSQLDDAGAVPPPAVITWANPSAITYGTALSSLQLNASADGGLAGTFEYTPPSGTILNIGNAQVLSVTFTPDDLTTHGPAIATVAIDVVPSVVVGRHIFYNRSAFDGNDAAANSADDAAIAPDKSALLPGGKGAFANYTSYSRGINGIMVDVSDLPGTPTVNDFAFKVGNNNTPGGWAAAQSPASITIRTGAGVSGADRITIIWVDGAIKKQWLQTTVKASTTTGLAADDVFYFGNALGEVGNSVTDAVVDSTDVLNPFNQQTSAGAATITSKVDLDRNRAVDTSDVLLPFNNQTSVATALKLIDLGGGGVGPASTAVVWPMSGEQFQTILDLGTSVDHPSITVPIKLIENVKVETGWLVLEASAQEGPLELQSSDHLDHSTWRTESIPTESDLGVLRWQIPLQSDSTARFFRVTRMNAHSSQQR